MVLTTQSSNFDVSSDHWPSKHRLLLLTKGVRLPETSLLKSGQNPGVLFGRLFGTLVRSPSYELSPFGCQHCHGVPYHWQDGIMPWSCICDRNISIYWVSLDWNRIPQKRSSVQTDFNFASIYRAPRFIGPYPISQRGPVNWMNCTS